MVYTHHGELSNLKEKGLLPLVTIGVKRGYYGKGDTPVTKGLPLYLHEVL